ncbi:MAG TPA: chemotaxis-specific protein-glutamate methyltransferase CheB [Candidatus Acidoferrales bacterium]|nr:chemotaxis-specific protein-glutamate methyltransferase CheB [Candidatus Acidoferrales bacterium]
MSQKTRVLVADDSPFVCRLLTSYLQSAAEFEVVGTAFDGQEALAKAKALRPDALTLDLEMPGMDGLEALAQIMRECPTPVVAVSGVSGRAAARTLQALDLGAVDFVLKYAVGANIHPAELCREVLAKVRAASRIRVVRSLSSRTGSTHRNAAAAPREPRPPDPEAEAGLVVIGASTGGPLALRELLSRLPADMGAGIVVVQHMSRDFTPVLAAQLDRHCHLGVREGQDGDRVQPGTVLVAPGGSHLLLRPGFRVAVHAGSRAGGYCPSIDAAMESAARIYGSRTVGVLLTGMGDDGARGMQAIHEKGGTTFVQDSESCVVEGMPERARERAAVDGVAPPAEIARLLIKELERRAQSCGTRPSGG